LSASEHTIILGDFNVNRNTTPSTLVPKIKSIFQIIVKYSGDN
jgi:hypothetical protein